MNREEQIAEMEKIIKAEYEQWLDTTGVIPKASTYYAECLGCAIDSAETLYNVAGYRKIPENAVVLTKEEYIDLSRNYVREQIEKARKETAKVILYMLYDMGIDKETLECCKIYDVNGVSLAKQICEKYGVEVEE